MQHNAVVDVDWGRRGNASAGTPPRPATTGLGMQSVNADSQRVSPVRATTKHNCPWRRNSSGHSRGYGSCGRRPSASVSSSSNACRSCAPMRSSISKIFVSHAFIVLNDVGSVLAYQKVVFLVVAVRHDAREECRHRHHTRAVVPRFIFCEWEAAGLASERLAGARRSPARRIDCA